MQVTINHIALYVRNLQKSTFFYKEIMQLKSIPEPFNTGNHSWFQVGDRCQLHLIGGAKDAVTLHINNHISFSTHSVDDFAKRLNEEGIVYYDAFKKRGVIYVRPDGIKQIFFQDPDGYWLEMNNDIKS
jgi:lactoylglutathione lyase